MNNIPFAELDPSNTLQVSFNGHTISITSAPQGKRIDISESLRDRSDFHGPTDVDHVVNFGPAMRELICTYVYPPDFYDEDISVLTAKNAEADSIVSKIDGLARQLIANGQLYDDPAFCRQYYDLAAQGYKLLPTNKLDQIPVSLIRAGLVTTRLALGEGIDAVIPNEVQVETKRAHPKGGAHEDLMVTVRWAHPEDPMKLKNKDILVADFVNPASWSSTAALLLVLAHCFDVRPKSVEHRSFIATAQGIDLARRECAALGIKTWFNLVGITDTMNDNYYLSGKLSVADAGHALRHFRPKI